MKKLLLSLSLLTLSNGLLSVECQRHSKRKVKSAELEELHNDYIHAKWQYEKAHAQSEENKSKEKAKRGWQKVKKDIGEAWEDTKETAGHNLEKAQADVKYAWEKTKAAVTPE